MRRQFAIAFGLAVIAWPAHATELTLPASADLLAERPSPLASYALPLGPSEGDEVPTRPVEGRILRRTWRLQGDATSLQIFAPLRGQLETAGYDILFQCVARDCGGFDFRFGIEVVPAPDMTVDIGDYHFLSATRTEAEAVSLLVSRSGNTAYVQVIEVSPPKAAPVVVIVPEEITQGAMDNGSGTEFEIETDIEAALIANGRVVLSDLSFKTGSANLEAGPFDSLAALARVLTVSPEYRVTLVGHTDNVGSLVKNTELSKRRANAVRQRILERFDLDGSRIEVAGAGYLAPLASNLTAQGREANRRVEAVLMQK